MTETLNCSGWWHIVLPGERGYVSGVIFSHKRQSQLRRALATKGIYWPFRDTSEFRPGWIQGLSVAMVTFSLHPPSCSRDQNITSSVASFPEQGLERAFTQRMGSDRQGESVPWPGPGPHSSVFYHHSFAFSRVS